MYINAIVKKYTINQEIKEDWELYTIFTNLWENKYLGNVSQNAHKKNSDTWFALSDKKYTLKAV